MNRFWAIAGAFLITGCVDGAPTSDGNESNTVSIDKKSKPKKPKKAKKEKFLYVATINAGGSADPDMVILVGTDPDDDDFGKIIERVDMPSAGDELHHFGYSADKKQLIVPGLFSNEIHVLDLDDADEPELANVASLNDTGYIVPHTVIAQHDGTALVTMIGSTVDSSTSPGGIIRVDEFTGEFIDYFGPGPVRGPGAAGPNYMYDFDSKPNVNRGVSTTFGAPADLAGGINPAGLGDEIYVWDLAQERVIQTINLGANSGALEARWLNDEGSYGYTNAPGTGAVWLWEDEDGDGFLSVHQVLGPEDGLAIPADMLLSEDQRYMFLTNWFGNTVHMYDIADRYNPVLVDEVVVPHPNMLRLSPDGKRLYVSNSLLSTWDNDANFGPARNTDYGIWLYAVDENGMTSHTADNSAWVDFDAIEKQSGVGPAGPHMMLFDPRVATPFGHH